MSADRPIRYVKKVIHFLPDGRGEGHRHEIIWQDGGDALEGTTGQFFYKWSNGQWVMAKEPQQILCREIVKESERKRRSFWSRARR